MSRKIVGIVLAIAAGLLFLIVVSGNTYNAGSMFARSGDIPLPATQKRPQLLTFGMYVTPDPEQNPIDPPERFRGYHTGLDIEIFDHERDKRIPVTALCEGEIISSGFAEGYGGLIVQQCTLEGESVTVLYGHLQLDSLAAENTVVQRGDEIGVLADEYSHGSGETRKHLHMSIHRGIGTEIDIRGYVQTEEELGEFINPETVLN